MTSARRQFLSFALTLPAALLVAACSSSPATNFYTLASVSPSTDAPSPVPLPRAIVAVGPVSLPDYLDRPQIVTRTSDYAMSLAAFDQWAGPLADMLPRVLVDDMGQRLPNDRVVRFPQVSGPSFDYRIAININRFDVDESGMATLVASWQVYEPQAARAALVADGTFRHQAASLTYESYAASLSATLAELSDGLIASLTSVRSSAPRPIAMR